MAILSITRFVVKSLQFITLNLLNINIIELIANTPVANLIKNLRL